MTTDQAPQLSQVDLHWLLNQYRAAEVHGAGAIMRMSKLAETSALRASLVRHLRDEAVHAWLWTRALDEAGGEVFSVPEPYQQRLSSHYGIPTSLNDMLVLSLVSEKRGVAQYENHLGEAPKSKTIQQTLRAIIKDEEWHVRYIREELEDRMKRDREVIGLMERAEEADRLAVAQLREESAGPIGW